MKDAPPVTATGRSLQYDRSSCEGFVPITRCFRSSFGPSSTGPRARSALASHGRWRSSGSRWPSRSRAASFQPAPARVCRSAHRQPCKRPLPEVARWQAEYDQRVTIAVVARGEPAQNRAIAQEHRVGNVLVQIENEVADAYRVAATPPALLVLDDGTLGSGVGAGAEAIRLALAAALRRSGHEARRGPSIEVMRVRPQEPSAWGSQRAIGQPARRSRRSGLSHTNGRPRPS